RRLRARRPRLRRLCAAQPIPGHRLPSHRRGPADRGGRAVTPEYIFNVWAAPGGLWSPWVKPVLFAHVNPLSPLATLEPPAQTPIGDLPKADGQTPVILDLPRE